MPYLSSSISHLKLQLRRSSLWVSQERKRSGNRPIRRRRREPCRDGLREARRSIGHARGWRCASPAASRASQVLALLQTETRQHKRKAQRRRREGRQTKKRERAVLRDLRLSGSSGRLPL